MFTKVDYVDLQSFRLVALKLKEEIHFNTFSCQVKCYLLNLRIGHLFICRKRAAGTRGGERERVFLIFSFLVVSAYASLLACLASLALLINSVYSAYHSQINIKVMTVSL